MEKAKCNAASLSKKSDQMKSTEKTSTEPGYVLWACWCSAKCKEDSQSSSSHHQKVEKPSQQCLDMIKVERRMQWCHERIDHQGDILDEISEDKDTCIYQLTLELELAEKEKRMEETELYLHSAVQEICVNNKIFSLWSIQMSELTSSLIFLALSSDINTKYCKMWKE